MQSPPILARLAVLPGNGIRPDVLGPATAAWLTAETRGCVMETAVGGCRSVSRA